MTRIVEGFRQHAAFCGLPFILVMIIILRVAQLDGFAMILYLLLAVFGYVAAVLDIKTKKIPNKLILAMLAAWIITLVPRVFFDTSQAVALLIDSSLGFILGGTLFFLVYLVSRKGIGGGDVKLMAVTGLYLGLYGIVPAIFCGSILAAATGLALIGLKKIKRKDTIPLAPFLYAGMLTAMLLG